MRAVAASMDEIYSLNYHINDKLDDKDSGRMPYEDLSCLIGQQFST